ncbi:hypothetical protein [Oscillibacter sp.]|uniref:hypothetical protein n=1 Tax=Oscillibacter sp. TaxID=1945593 RepID=UPI0028A06868|nr:hypothetical protein [Oscillibacter sp.]
MKSGSVDMGVFRKKKGFTISSNSAIRDANLSLKARGLYVLIQSYITLETIDLTKTYLVKHCNEGDTAFDSAWNELKKNGYLKVHIYPAERGRFCYEYELLDEANLRGGVYLYRYNSKGEVSSTNAGADEPTVKEPLPAHHPDFHPSGKHPGGDHASGDHHGSNRGGNIILPLNTKDNTLNKDSINLSDVKTVQASESDGLSEAEIKEQVIDELGDQQKVPYVYASDQRKMQAAIHYLTEWDFFQKHPYTTLRGFVDEPRMNAFNFCVDCLIDMACAQEIRNYRGASISYAKVIDAINNNSNHCCEGGLLEFLEEAMDDFIKAYENTDVRDKRKYAMSVLWNCFSTYKVKQDAEYIG